MGFVVPLTPSSSVDGGTLVVVSKQSNRDSVGFVVCKVYNLLEGPVTIGVSCWFLVSLHRVYKDLQKCKEPVDKTRLPYTLLDRQGTSGVSFSKGYGSDLDHRQRETPCPTRGSGSLFDISSESLSYMRHPR